MHVRRGHPSREQLEHSFARMLSMVLAGHGVRTCTGLDDETKNALRVIARAYPHAGEESVEAARRAFAGQLDGSNAARWHARHDRDLAERAARSQRPPQG